MSLALEDLSKNYWKYHFDSVLLGSHLLIDIASNLVRINFIYICNFHYFLLQ
jgi:hypothetical protein